MILFDGLCNLCNGFVRFVIARDPDARFQFAALQSPSARRVLEALETPDPLPDSIVLVEDGKVYTQSAAALRIARHLSFPFPLAFGLLVIPPPLRDGIYGWVARHRSRWFGRQDQCMVPTPALRSRFID